MRIFIDCEYNGFGGELISMALVAENGKEFYEVTWPGDYTSRKASDWVEKNVVPKLEKERITQSHFLLKLYQFLGQFDSIHVIADWPEDIHHFCMALLTGPGMRMDTPPLTMEVVRIDTVSKNPHNALADARALRDALAL
jgi:hypothetical protein